MSCSQVAIECSQERFSLVYPHPTVFYQWRYTRLNRPNTLTVYRFIFAIIFLTLLIMDYIWIIIQDSKFPDFLSWCLDASQWALLSTAICYLLLACNTLFVTRQNNGETNNESTTPYKGIWLLYTCSINSVYSTMTLHWMFSVTNSNLEQTLKHSIPGCLILLDLFLNNIPLYLCHAVYPVIVYLVYLAIATLGMYLAYIVGDADKTVTYPSNPTVLIGGHPLLTSGYQDFTNIPRIFIVLFGAISIGIMIHCVLLTLVITRDFLASLCQLNTNEWVIEDDTYLVDNSTLDLFSRQSSSTIGVHNQGENEKPH
ncbi:unnamed protein product [Heterobilharzia americana]|nr:unnamed protein product [Heterobilharzia americana]CAH8593267.1 unnamed protein product [Heterobilharzia americana]CAH8593282.1 unnamed protein product [Heterobilharzia americana]